MLRMPHTPMPNQWVRFGTVASDLLRNFRTPTMNTKKPLIAVCQNLGSFANPANKTAPKSGKSRLVSFHVRMTIITNIALIIVNIIIFR